MHIDGDTLNDYLDNLTWISRNKQYIDPNTNGKITGEKYVNSKFTNAYVSNTYTWFILTPLF